MRCSGEIILRKINIPNLDLPDVTCLKISRRGTDHARTSATTRAGLTLVSF